MSYRLDTELFIVRFQNSIENKIMSKAEVQHLLKIECDRRKITAIRKITVDSMESVKVSYFRPKKLSPYNYNKKLWDKICGEFDKCQEQ